MLLHLSYPSIRSEHVDLREKLNALEGERHKLLNALTTTSLRDSSPSSIESSSPTAGSAVISTSNQVSTAINSLFQPSTAAAAAASVNQVKQERPFHFHLTNTISSNNHNNNHNHHHHHHMHPVLTTHAPMVDQMSVIVTVTSASSVPQVHNSMSHEQLMSNVSTREHNSLAGRTSNGNSLLVHQQRQQQQQQQQESESSREDINSHVETHESNHEGLVNLKISPMLKNDHTHESSSPSSSSPVSINNDSSTSTSTSHVIHHNSHLDEAVNH